MNKLRHKARTLNKNPEKVAFLLVLILGIIFRIWVSEPTWMHFDENYYLNTAQNYAIHGEMSPYLWRLGETSVLFGGGSGYGSLLLNAWLNLVNNSLYWGRIFMVMCNLLTALVVYFIARIWWNSKVAGVTAFLFSIVCTSAFYTLIVRMDAPAILTYSLMLLLHVVAVRNNKPYLHAAVGVAAILTTEFHPIGLLYVIALTCWYLYQQVNGILVRKKIIINKNSLAFVVGALVSGLIYLYVHVLPDPDVFFYISRACFECNEPLWITEWKRLVRIVILRPHEILVFALVIIGLLRVRPKESHHYLIIVAGWMIGQVLIGPSPYVHYTNHFWPLLALGVGGWFTNSKFLMRFRWRIPLGYAVAFVFLLLNLGLHLTNHQPYMLAYSLKSNPAIEYVLKNIDIDTVVMGDVPTYYPLKDYSNYLAYRDGSGYGAFLRDESMLDFWYRMQPQVILLGEEKYAGDIELQTYINENDFVKIMPELWLAPVLVK